MRLTRNRLEAEAIDAGRGTRRPRAGRPGGLPPDPPPSRRQPALVTESLRLRPLTEHDGRFLRALYLDREVTRFLQDGPYGWWRGRRMAGLTLRHGLQQLRISGYGPLVMERHGASRAVGLIGLSKIPILGAERVELSYMLVPSEWGQGLAVEAGRAVLEDAFGRLGLRQVWATCRQENARSLRVLQRLGFETTAMIAADREAVAEALPVFVLAQASAGGDYRLPGPEGGRQATSTSTPAPRQ